MWLHRKAKYGRNVRLWWHDLQCDGQDTTSRGKLGIKVTWPQTAEPPCDVRQEVFQISGCSTVVGWHLWWYTTSNHSLRSQPFTIDVVAVIPHEFQTGIWTTRKIQRFRSTEFEISVNGIRLALTCTSIILSVDFVFTKPKRIKKRINWNRSSDEWAKRAISFYIGITKKSSFLYVEWRVWKLSCLHKFVNRVGCTERPRLLVLVLNRVSSHWPLNLVEPLQYTR